MSFHCFTLGEPDDGRSFLWCVAKQDQRGIDKVGDVPRASFALQMHNTTKKQLPKILTGSWIGAGVVAFLILMHDTCSATPSWLQSLYFIPLENMGGWRSSYQIYCIRAKINHGWNILKSPTRKWSDVRSDDPISCRLHHHCYCCSKSLHVIPVHLFCSVEKLHGCLAESPFDDDHWGGKNDLSPLDVFLQSNWKW